MVHAVVVGDLRESRPRSLFRLATSRSELPWFCLDGPSSSAARGHVAEQPTANERPGTPLPQGLDNPTIKPAKSHLRHPILPARACETSSLCASSCVHGHVCDDGGLEAVTPVVRRADPPAARSFWTAEPSPIQTCRPAPSSSPARSIRRGRRIGVVCSPSHHVGIGAYRRCTLRNR